MPDLLVRDMSEEAMRCLKSRAALHGRSLQQEVRLLLIEAAAERPGDALDLAARLRARMPGPCASDSALLVREDRDR
jgi:plasmid stability protein